MYLKILIAKTRAFLECRRANVAMIFGLSVIPLIIGAGAGLDYARAMLVRQQMGEALDSAALAVGSTTGLDQAKAQDLAQKYFDANYTVDRTVYGSPTVSIPASGYDNKGSVLLTASNSMPTVLMKVAGITSVPIATASSVVWGQSKLWVALVLDNSGSMSQGDANGTKMSALKSASQQLLTVLQNASAHAGDVKAGIVPFTNVVKVGAGNVGASWLDWTDWEAAPKDSSGVTIDDAYLIPKSGVPLAAYGPHDDCPFTTTKTKNKNTTVSQDAPFGFSCQKNPNNNSGNVAAGAGASPIPPSGLICPTSNSAAFDNDHLARYYNGCWSSTAVPGATIQVSSGNGATCAGFNPANCSCSNNVCSTQKWTHVWVPNDHSSWSGCVADRRQDYDIQNTQPSGVSGFTAANPLSCIAASVTPLEYDWTALNSQITAMSSGGSTNQAVGVAHGWQMLTPGDPYATPALPANTGRYIILLSDGLNTQDRWWGDGSTEGTPQDDNIDAREKDTCDAAKANGVIIYTIFLDLNGAHGNSAPLQYCATDSTKYFDLTSTSTVVTTFNQIAQQITNVRVVR